MSAAMGALLVLFGYKIFMNPKLPNLYGDYYYDFTGYNKPFAIFVVLVGIAFIFLAFKSKNVTKR